VVRLGSGSSPDNLALILTSQLPLRISLISATRRLQIPMSSSIDDWGNDLLEFGFLCGDKVPQLQETSRVMALSKLEIEGG